MGSMLRLIASGPASIASKPRSVASVRTTFLAAASSPAIAIMSLPPPYRLSAILPDPVVLNALTTRARSEPRHCLAGRIVETERKFEIARKWIGCVHDDLAVERAERIERLGNRLPRDRKH